MHTIRIEQVSGPQTREARKAGVGNGLNFRPSGSPGFTAFIDYPNGHFATATKDTIAAARFEGEAAIARLNLQAMHEAAARSAPREAREGLRLRGIA